MKKVSLYFFVAALSLGMFVACDDNENTDPIDTGYGDMTDIINTYVDRTVLPTYAKMKDEAWKLYDAVIKLSEDGGLTNGNITASCDQWRATRVPWEQSEAFLYGPAESQNLDPLLDSWPLDQAGIDAVLKGGHYDEDALGAAVRGFHTIEYLIFDGGEPRTTAIFTDGYLEYLTVVTKVLRDDCIKLWSSWAGAGALQGKDAEAMEDIDFAPKENGYAYQFKNAGNPGSELQSQADAIDLIVEGCMTISDEVGAQKIGGPNGLAKAGNTAQAVLEVESWYSWNSITDYANNIESIRNSYLGGIEGNRGSSLSAYVKSQSEALDTEILSAIETAYSAIKNGMKSPFRSNLTGNEVDAAMNACDELTTAFEKIKTLKK